SSARRRPDPAPLPYTPLFRSQAEVDAGHTTEDELLGRVHLDDVGAVDGERTVAVGEERLEVEVRVQVRVELAGLRTEQTRPVTAVVRPGVADLGEPEVREVLGEVDVDRVVVTAGTREVRGDALTRVT